MPVSGTQAEGLVHQSLPGDPGQGLTPSAEGGGHLTETLVSPRSP